VATGPDIYLDGAHNPASARELAAALREMRTSYRSVVLVIGVLADKDFHGIVSELVPLADRVIVTMPAYARALDPRILAGEVRAIHADVSTAGTVGRAIEQAREQAGRNDLILITGSLYVVGDARGAILGSAGRSPSLSGLKG
jgi:dihydrofolate synthase/folylpolyglutamate synthase